MTMRPVRPEQIRLSRQFVKSRRLGPIGKRMAKARIAMTASLVAAVRQKEAAP